MVHVIENDEPKFEEASLNITCNPQYQVAPTIRPHQLSGRTNYQPHLLSALYTNTRLFTTL